MPDTPCTSLPSTVPPPKCFEKSRKRGRGLTGPPTNQELVMITPKLIDWCPPDSLTCRGIVAGYTPYFCSVRSVLPPG